MLYSIYVKDLDQKKIHRVVLNQVHSFTPLLLNITLTTHLNINLLRNKFELLANQVKGNVDTRNLKSFQKELNIVTYKYSESCLIFIIF